MTCSCRQLYAELAREVDGKAPLGSEVDADRCRDRRVRNPLLVRGFMARRATPPIPRRTRVLIWVVIISLGGLASIAVDEAIFLVVALGMWLRRRIRTTARMAND